MTTDEPLVPSIAALPAPPAGFHGWPWTEQTPPALLANPPRGGWPKITVVCPTYQQVKYIEETLRSVLLQGYPALEFIVMDGASQDGTLRCWKNIRHGSSTGNRPKITANPTHSTKALIAPPGNYLAGSTATIIICLGPLSPSPAPFLTVREASILAIGQNASARRLRSRFATTAQPSLSRSPQAQDTSKATPSFGHVPPINASTKVLNSRSTPIFSNASHDRVFARTISQKQSPSADTTAHQKQQR